MTRWPICHFRGVFAVLVVSPFRPLVLMSMFSFETRTAQLLSITCTRYIFIENSTQVKGQASFLGVAIKVLGLSTDASTAVIVEILV